MKPLEFSQFVPHLNDIQSYVRPCALALSAAHSRLAVLQVREVRLSRALEAATAVGSGSYCPP